MDGLDRIDALARMTFILRVIETIEESIAERLQTTNDPSFLDSSFVIKKIARSPIDIKQLIRYEANVSTSGAFSLDPKQYNEIEKNGLKIELANMEMAKGSSPDEALRSVMGLTKEEYEQAEKILEKDIYQMSSLFQSKQPILTSR